jgi:dTDP-4-amino-4,6-dideoxygalactose transaminase
MGGLPRCVGQLGGTTSLGDCLSAMGSLLRPGRLVDGPAVEEYERAFAELIGVRHACSVWAGRVGLYLLLASLDIGAGDEVLLQVPTHIVVANAIRYRGAQPVYVDCRAETCNIDLELAERSVTARTKAIVVQHTFGIPADMDAVLALADRQGLTVIEDCVHALGATYAGRRVGSFGTAAFFSTEETKTISSTMGGMVVTDDGELGRRLRALQAECVAPGRSQTAAYLLKLVAYHFLTEPHVHAHARRLYELAGRRNPLPRATGPDELSGRRPDRYEQRFSNAQAAVALRQLHRLDANLRHRWEIAEVYRRGLGPLGFNAPRPPEKAEPAYVRYPIWVADREAAMRRVRSRAVLGNWFTSVLEEATSVRHGDYRAGSCPRAEAAAVHLVNLPTNPRVTRSDAEALTECLRDVTPWQA